MFVTSSSVSVAATGSVPIPQIIDVGGNGVNGTRHSHIQVVGVISTGGLTITFDTAATPAHIVAGIDNVVIPIPTNALNVALVASTGGMGTVNFGRAK